MKTITQEQLSQMKAAQDAAASDFWAYPGDEWQVAFQEAWLRHHVGASAAKDEAGIVWGAFEDEEN